MNFSKQLIILAEKAHDLFDALRPEEFEDRRFLYYISKHIAMMGDAFEQNHIKEDELKYERQTNEKHVIQNYERFIRPTLGDMLAKAILHTTDFYLTRYGDISEKVLDISLGWNFRQHYAVNAQNAMVLVTVDRIKLLTLINYLYSWALWMNINVFWYMTTYIEYLQACC